mmetsp:Transcript_21941/g.27145  ORF Transcript_21941/g.27145 Transcript_21941/m.27145 type:complete len:235 (+) Transcript_21941:78-782(+)
MPVPNEDEETAQNSTVVDTNIKKKENDGETQRRRRRASLPSLRDHMKNAKRDRASRRSMLGGGTFASLRNLFRSRKSMAGTEDGFVIDQPRETKIRFSTVEIRDYSSMPSLNPAVTSGPAVGLGWDVVRSSSVDLETYESELKTPKTGKPEVDVPRLTPAQRVKRLRDAGMTDKDIVHAMTQSDSVRSLRQKTIKTYYFRRGIKRRLYRATVFFLPRRFVPAKLGVKLNMDKMN